MAKTQVLKIHDVFTCEVSMSTTVDSKDILIKQNQNIKNKEAMFKI